MNYKITSKTVSGKLTFYIKYRALPFIWRYLRNQIGDKESFSCYIQAKGFLNKLNSTGI